MNSNNPIRNYKHDISGKFKDISTAIGSMNETSFDEPENNELFHAVHEVLLRMVKTSRNTLFENLKQEMVLIVSDRAPDHSLPTLHIEGVTVRYEMSKEQVSYRYFTLENTGSLPFNLGKLSSSLPFKEILREGISDFSKFTFEFEL